MPVPQPTQIITVLGNARGMQPMPGSAFCRLTTHFSPTTVALCVSQSGQTFPTIHATRILRALLPDRVYAMCGSM